MADDEIEALVAEVNKQIETVVIEFVVEAVANLRDDTPVDTGHARANWIPSKGSPVLAEDGAVTISGNARATSAGQAQQGGLAEILSYEVKDGDAWIANNVPYIVGPGSLNDGHSQQAPRAFIEAAVARALTTVAARYGADVDPSVVIGNDPEQ